MAGLEVWGSTGSMRRVTNGGYERPADAGPNYPAGVVVGPIVVGGARVVVVDCSVSVVVLDPPSVVVTEGTVPGMSIDWNPPFDDQYATATTAITTRALRTLLPLRAGSPWYVTGLHLGAAERVEPACAHTPNCA